MRENYKTFSARLYQSEVEEIRNIASVLGISQADLIRKRVIRQEPIVDKLDSEFELLKNDLDGWLEYHFDNYLGEFEKKLESIVEKKIAIAIAENILPNLEKFIIKAVDKANGWE